MCVCGLRGPYDRKMEKAGVVQKDPASGFSGSLAYKGELRRECRMIPVKCGQSAVLNDLHAADLNTVPHGLRQVSQPWCRPRQLRACQPRALQTT